MAADRFSMQTGNPFLGTNMCEAFVNILSQLLSNPVRRGALSLLCRWENWISEKRSDLPHITLFVRGRIRFKPKPSDPQMWDPSGTPVLVTLQQ